MRSLGERLNILLPPRDCSLLVPEAVKYRINVMYKGEKNWYCEVDGLTYITQYTLSTDHNLHYVPCME